jgi:signal transduction histidine kinase
MRHLQFVRSNTFHWAFMAAGVFAAFILVLFGSIYWQIDSDLIARSDRVITAQLDGIAGLSPEPRLEATEERLRQDPRGVQLAAIFAADGRRVTGNVKQLPAELRIDGPAQGAEIVRIDRGEGATDDPRDFTADDKWRRAGARTQCRRGQRDVRCRRAGARARSAARVCSLPAVRRMAQRACAEAGRGGQSTGSAHHRRRSQERLPYRAVDEPFSKLAVIVNGMLDEMETMIHALAGVGNDIAHDLRTPLTRARLALERGRTNAHSLEQLQAVVDKAIAGIDQSLTIITALLRLAEIENSRRSAAFYDVALQDMLREVGDIYEPIAENKSIALHVEAPDPLSVRGDRDLLIEAVANLVDNAIKLTPEGGRVDIAMSRSGDGTVVSVNDSGRGISEQEREAVLRRFYRSDKIRNTPGVGLGLSLVAAIVKLLGFRLTIQPGPACRVEIACPDRRD